MAMKQTMIIFISVITGIFVGIFAFTAIMMNEDFRDKFLYKINENNIENSNQQVIAKDNCSLDKVLERENECLNTMMDDKDMVRKVRLLFVVFGEVKNNGAITAKQYKLLQEISWMKLLATMLYLDDEYQWFDHLLIGYEG